jgi:hypothetical protein
MGSYGRHVSLAYSTQTGTLPARRTRKVRFFASCTCSQNFRCTRPAYTIKELFRHFPKRKGAESNQIGNVKLIAPYCTCLLSSFVMHFWSPSQRLFCACVSFGRRAQEKVVADLRKRTHPLLLPKCNAQRGEGVQVWCIIWYTIWKTRSFGDVVVILTEDCFDMFWISFNKLLFQWALVHCIAAHVTEFKFCKTPFNIIDFIALLAAVVELFSLNLPVDPTMLRLCRLAKLFRTDFEVNCNTPVLPNNTPRKLPHGTKQGKRAVWATRCSLGVQHGVNQRNGLKSYSILMWPAEFQKVLYRSCP